MSVIVFILVLVALIVVHELGHFFAAKWAGMRVDEFGLGYPPRALLLKRHKGTDYTLNWLPFGGFVKIHGEDGVGGAKAPADSFVGKPHYVQALVLLAGILMNLVFAWVLLSATLAIGMPRALDDDQIAQAIDAKLVVTSVLPGSPAADAGIMPGDAILHVTDGGPSFAGADPSTFTAFVASTTAGVPLSFTYQRSGAEPELVNVTPETGIISDAPERVALGVGVSAVGTIPVSLIEAPIEGAKLTYQATGQIATGLVQFFGSIFTFSADLSQVSGPIGIAGAVGDASATSIAALMTLVAVISINLALINVLPIPALDGGRLLFVLIEAVTRKPIPESVSGAFNAAGFALLILLMVVVTASDIWKLVS